MNGRRVVVTGMGVISPIGNCVADFHEALFSMKSGIGPITRFPAARLPTRIAAEVKGWAQEFRDVKIGFALGAAREAMAMAFGDRCFPAGIDSVLSLGIGLELFNVEDLIALRRRGYDQIPETRSLDFLNTPSDICAHLISREFHLTQSPLIHVSACAAGTDAIGAAFARIRAGKTTVALAGGADSMINPMGVAGFSKISAMTLKNETPGEASAPFDASRDGFVLGEGAGLLVLEEESFALRRGGRPLAMISGYGNSLDAYNVSDPHPEGDGARRAMGRALEAAQLHPSQISAISAHGTGTPKNDPVEAKAIRDLFHGRVSELPVFATKSLIGHLISAAGAVESVACILSLAAGRVHATANLRKVGEGCELDHVRGRPREVDLQHIMKNSFGFGGQNASIVISKWHAGDARG